MSRFTILEHPADIGFEARGSTLGDAFAAAAEALISLVVDTTSKPEREHRSLTIQASDREQLLVKFLSEILYLFDGEGFVCKRTTVKAIDDHSLTAELSGEKFDPASHETKLGIKAVTYHQLIVEERKGEFILRVYLDV